jgi:hypothetical protein
MGDHERETKFREKTQHVFAEWHDLGTVSEQMGAESVLHQERAYKIINLPRHTTHILCFFPFQQIVTGLKVKCRWESQVSTPHDPRALEYSRLFRCRSSMVRLQISINNTNIISIQ